MQSIFHNCNQFNSDLSKWNVSNVNDMQGLFKGCVSFNSDLSGWNVTITSSRTSLTRNGFADGSPLALPENSHKLPPFV